MTKILSVFILAVTSIFAQENLNRWIPSAIVSFNFSQTQFSNWTKGGENTYSGTFVGEAKLDYQNESINFTNLLKTSYGKSQIGKDFTKTLQNDLLFNNKLSYKTDWLFNYFAGINLITQNAPGYNYDSSEPIQVSAIFDPADLTEAFGLIYEPNAVFTTQVGVGFHQIFGNEFTAKTDDIKTAEIETFKSEMGIESISKLNLKIEENISYGSFLRLYSGFERLGTWDVRWDNIITAKVNSWLHVNLTFLMVYDVSESFTTQAKEALEVGISYRLL